MGQNIAHGQDRLVAPQTANSTSNDRAATIEALFAQLDASERGLTTPDAQRRLAEAGPNELAPLQRATLIIQLLRFFANPLVAILLIAGLVSAAFGELINATIIVVV